MTPDEQRAVLSRLLTFALDAVDPEPLTKAALQPTSSQPATLVAIGKAAVAMCRGAAAALEVYTGICVTNEHQALPPPLSEVVGDHPLPGEGSFLAGEQVIEVTARSQNRIVALISGGGSALCEYPIEGVSHSFLAGINTALMRAGAPIDDMNLVRRHLSAIKGGRLLRFAHHPVETLVMSDVCGSDASVVASGPTIPQPHDPSAALAIMSAHGLEVPSAVRRAVEAEVDDLPQGGPVTVLADGKTAARAVVASAEGLGTPARLAPGWVSGHLDESLVEFISAAGPGITVATGEPEVAVTGSGRGGRNTHAALMAAGMIAGTDAMFAAFATDGLDGNSDSAGAIVDGTTIARGGDPTAALARSDSAAYLERSGDLVTTGPTGTNVSDLWVLWR